VTIDVGHHHLRYDPEAPYDPPIRYTRRQTADFLSSTLTVPTHSSGRPEPPLDRHPLPGQGNGRLACRFQDEHQDPDQEQWPHAAPIKRGVRTSALQPGERAQRRLVTSQDIQVVQAQPNVVSVPGRARPSDLETEVGAGSRILDRAGCQLGGWDARKANRSPGTGSDTRCMKLPAARPFEAFDPRPLFWRARSGLLALLDSLTPSDWRAPTVADPWLVRDLVSHLLGDDLARLSRSRDAYSPGRPPGDETLATFLNRHNAEWVDATQRLSPRVLTELLTTTSAQIRAFWESTDLSATGEPVSWAGPDPAPVWLDCARDFTEDWVHQQQIREALDHPLTDPAALGAVVDTFMHAIPKTLHDHTADRDDGITFDIRLHDQTGDSTTLWTWLHNGGTWIPSTASSSPAATLSCDADTWWRLCVRMITPHQAGARSKLDGDPELLDAALQTIAIIRDP
jgi:uncharacterized protein (TIGR03083 family)